ncbi:hypothetical protein [Lactobacillus crispatus]|uniref:hypothetical protein n=1 Tax=Lactobacillus crispatus TaxID=47770 RepID=UPI0030F4E969
MKKLNEEELVEVKGGFAITNMVFNQNLFAMNNIVRDCKIVCVRMNDSLNLFL